MGTKPMTMNASGLIGVLKGLDYADLGTKACKLWFYALLLTLMLQTLEMKYDKDASEDEEKQLSLYSNCCDIVAAAHGSGYIASNQGTDVMKNVLMIMSAMIGLKKVRLSLK